MTKLILYSAIALLTAAAPNAEAGHRDNDRHHSSKHSRTYRSYRHNRTRSVYFIERNRPVRRVVYVNSDGRYYNYSSGRRVWVTGRYYDSYPSRYYYPDGRRRLTISLPF